MRSTEPMFKSFVQEARCNRYRVTWELLRSRVGLGLVAQVGDDAKDERFRTCEGRESDIAWATEGIRGVLSPVLGDGRRVSLVAADLAICSWWLC